MKIKKILWVGCLLLITTSTLNSQEKESYLKKGKKQLFYGSPKKSISLFKKAIEYFTAKKERAKIADSYNQLSKAYRSISEFDIASEYANKALKISRDKKSLDKREEAKALDNLALINSIKRNLKRALMLHKKALQIRLAFLEKDSLSRAISFYHIGNVLVGQNQYKEATNYFDKALQINLNLTPENQIILADIHMAISYIYFDKGEYDNALKSLEKTLLLASSVFGRDNPYFAKVYNKLGVIYSMKEQLNESLQYYQKALSINIKTYGINIHPDQAKIHFNMGTIYRKKGLIKKALFHTQKAIDIGIKLFGERYENLFFPYSQMGQIYGNEKGISYIEKALAIYQGKPDKNPLRISYLYEYISNIYFKNKDYSKALKFAQKSLKIRLKSFGENNTHCIRSLNMISKLYSILKEYDQALVYNQRALDANWLKKIDEDQLLESVKTKADIYFKLYQKLNKKESLQKSVNLYKRAAFLIDNARKRKRNYDDKIAFSETVKSVYGKNIETSLLLHKLNNNNPLEVSFYYSEKSRGNVIRELMKNIEAKEIFNISSETLSYVEIINTKIARLTSEILKEITNKDRDTTKIYTLEGKILDLTRKKDSLERRIETDFPEYYKLKYQKNIIEVFEVQQKLNKRTTLIEFFKSGELLYVFIVSKDSFHVKKLKIIGLNRKIQELNTSIINKNHSLFTKSSFNLYQSLINPIKEYLVGNRLIIIPDESLWHLQFDLLLTEETKSDDKKIPYLLFDYAISYANSASFLFDDFKKRETKGLKDECIAFSYSITDSIKNNSMPLSKLRNSKIDLPGTRKEISEISKIFDGMYYYGVDANEINFKKNANQYKLVHLALHGEVDNISPKNSKIYFTDIEIKEQEDNILYAHELYAVNIPASLVVISACNTGSGQINKGEGILSLGNAFQHAGAKSLLLSKWEISDKTTPEIIKYFYKNLKKGMNKSEAIRQAKLTFLKKSNYFNEAPFYWGGFYLIGNVDPIIFEESKMSFISISILIILALTFFFLIRKITLKKNLLF